MVYTVYQPGHVTTGILVADDELNVLLLVAKSYIKMQECSVIINQDPRPIGDKQ